MPDSLNIGGELPATSTMWCEVQLNISMIRVIRALIKTVRLVVLSEKRFMCGIAPAALIAERLCTKSQEYHQRQLVDVSVPALKKHYSDVDARSAPEEEM